MHILPELTQYIQALPNKRQTLLPIRVVEESPVENQEKPHSTRKTEFPYSLLQF